MTHSAFLCLLPTAATLMTIHTYNVACDCCLHTALSDLFQDSSKNSVYHFMFPNQLISAMQCAPWCLLGSSKPRPSVALRYALNKSYAFSSSAVLSFHAHAEMIIYNFKTFSSTSEANAPRGWRMHLATEFSVHVDSFRSSRLKHCMCLNLRTCFVTWWRTAASNAQRSRSRHNGSNYKHCIHICNDIVISKPGTAKKT